MQGFFPEAVIKRQRSENRKHWTCQMSPHCAASSQSLSQNPLSRNRSPLLTSHHAFLPLPRNKVRQQAEGAETWPLSLVSRSIAAQLGSARLGCDAAPLGALASALAEMLRMLSWRVPGTTLTERDADHALPSPTDRGRCGCKQLIHQRLGYIFIYLYIFF